MSTKTVRETVLYYNTYAVGFRIRLWVRYSTTPSEGDSLFGYIKQNPHLNGRRMADGIAATFPDYVNAVEVYDPITNTAELTYNDWP